MATRLSPFGIFVKWLVFPASLFAAGYFFVGPQFGADVVNKVQNRTTEPAEESKPAETPSDKPSDTPKTFPEPVVDVSARRVEVRPQTRRKRHSRKKADTRNADKPSADSTADAPVVVPPTDEGSVGGMDGQ